MWTTHEVTNQPSALADYDAWHADRVLATHARGFRATDPAFLAQARALGGYVGSAQAQALADQANRHAPVLQTHDRYGRQRDEVEFHPAWHALMDAACRHGLKGWQWTQPRAQAAVERALLFHLWNGLEQGSACPITMSGAAVALLSLDAKLRERLVAKVCAPAYEPVLGPFANKQALTIGMAMTEKQGGSDLRANATRANYDPAGGDWAWRLVGHKWFCSAPMSDGFFTLARTDSGLGCFFVPRVLDDGTRNAIRLRRLKDKCGNRSNASAEIEYEGAWARPVGAPGRGIATLIGMAHLTRFDIVCAVPGMMRAALSQALHHTAQRAAFDRRLAEHGLMRNVLADLALEWEAALLLALELARCFGAAGAFSGVVANGGPRRDDGESDAGARALARVLTPIAKYWLCKRLPGYVVECMECLGGNGYIEEWPLARLYREAPLNGIWEGSANVVCLDVLRSMQRDPQAIDALLDRLAATDEARLQPVRVELESALRAGQSDEAGARRLVGRLALAMQAVLMREHAPADYADAFIASRFDPQGGWAYGSLRADGAVLARVVERARLAL